MLRSEHRFPFWESGNRSWESSPRPRDSQFPDPRGAISPRGGNRGNGPTSNPWSDLGPTSTPPAYDRGMRGTSCPRRLLMVYRLGEGLRQVQTPERARYAVVVLLASAVTWRGA